MSQDSLYELAAAPYGASLDRLARAYELDPEARRDLLQDIHLHLWRSFAHFDQRCSLRTWVYRVAHNVATGHVIRQKRVRDRLVSIENIDTMPGSDQNEPAVSQTEALDLSLDADSNPEAAGSPDHRFLPGGDGRQFGERNYRTIAGERRNESSPHQNRARLKARFSIITGLILFVFFGSQAFPIVRRGLLPGMGLALISSWCLYFAYQAYRWTWPGRLAPDAALNTTIKSYRSELEKQGDYARHIWWKTGLPFCFLGLALVVVPGLIEAIHHPGRLMNFVPIFVLLVLWFVAFLFIRKRDRQKIQREIQELRAFEAESQA